MAGVRDSLWNYPKGVIFLINRFRFLFVILAGIVIGGIACLLTYGVATLRIKSQVFDKTLHIGVVSSFTTINPLDVGSSDAEKIASKLLFNGLISINEAGQMYPELADTWEISPDGKTYTFFLKKNIRWHDNVEFTAKDVSVTFALLQSSNSGNIAAIAQKVKVTVSGPYEIAFTLPQTNAAFLELMTLPILPEHIYKNMSFGRITELGDSLEPVGTGPYVYVSHKNGVITFQSNPKYFKGTPKIATVTITHFDSYELGQKAFLKGDIHILTPLEGTAMSDMLALLQDSSNAKVSAIPQSNNVRLIFFNVKKKSDVKDDEQSLALQNDIRQAAAFAVNHLQVSSLVSFSRPAYGPYDSSSYIYSADSLSPYAYDPSKANEILEKAGWKYPISGALYRNKNNKELKLTLTYLDTQMNASVAQNIRTQLEKVGINLVLRAVSSDDLQQSVLSQRDFELLLFEVQTGVDPDQYGLWHSSQAAFPGLNLGGFNSSTVDNLLEKGRLQLNRDKRIAIYTDFQKQLMKEAPVIFLYHPAQVEAYFDIIDRKLPDTVVDLTDRYTTIQDWTLLPGWRNWQTR